MSEHCCSLKSLRNEKSGRSPSDLLAFGLLQLELKAWCKYSGRERALAWLQWHNRSSIASSEIPTTPRSFFLPVVDFFCLTESAGFSKGFEQAHLLGNPSIYEQRTR